MRRIFGWDFERYRSLQGRSPSKSAGCTRIEDRETELPGQAKGKRISEKIGVALWVCSVSNAQPKLHLFCLIPHFMMHAEQPIAVPLPCFFRVNYMELNRHFQLHPALWLSPTPPRRAGIRITAFFSVVGQFGSRMPVPSRGGPGPPERFRGAYPRSGPSV